MEMHDRLKQQALYVKQMRDRIEKERQKELRRRIEAGAGEEEAQSKLATRILLNLDYRTVTPETIRYLIENEGAEVNAMIDSPFGGETFTPLRHAQAAENHAACEVLEQLGAVDFRGGSLQVGNGAVSAARQR